MKSRDGVFLLAGLLLGALVAAVLLPHRAASADLKPVATETSTPIHDTASTSAPIPAPTPDTDSLLGGNVYLAGQVHKEGVVAIRPNETITVSQALALDGGMADFADRRRVKLLRKSADGSSEVIPVDLQLSDSGYVKDPTVKPGDLINVPDKQAQF